VAGQALARGFARHTTPCPLAVPNAETEETPDHSSLTRATTRLRRLPSVTGWVASVWSCCAQFGA